MISISASPLDLKVLRNITSKQHLYKKKLMLHALYGGSKSIHWDVVTATQKYLRLTVGCNWSNIISFVLWVIGRKKNYNFTKWQNMKLTPDDELTLFGYMGQKPSKFRRTEYNIQSLLDYLPPHPNSWDVDTVRTVDILEVIYFSEFRN